MVEQQLENLAILGRAEVHTICRRMQGGSPVSFARIGVRAVFQQNIHSRDMIPSSGSPQRRSFTVACWVARIDFCPRVKQRFENVGMIHGAEQQRPPIRLLIIRVSLEFQKQRYHRKFVPISCEPQRCYVAAIVEEIHIIIRSPPSIRDSAGRIGVRAGIEQEFSQCGVLFVDGANQRRVQLSSVGVWPSRPEAVLRIPANRFLWHDSMASFLVYLPCSVRRPPPEAL